MEKIRILLISLIVLSAQFTGLSVDDGNLVKGAKKTIAPTKSTGMIPELNWEKRSDWIDVKTDVKPAAKGDGVADDTEAIQAALNMANKAMTGTTIYFPPGTYRITKTLTLGNNVKNARLQGVLLVGHGRNTVFAWDGEDKGRMFWLIGAANTRYVGIVWDGRGKAAVGIDHSARHFETELRHQHEAF
ncbi:MAG: glycosyl hydrolase family 28-related protein [Lentisphaerae bacterium]|nr:glycosyl hydrolase family 28-related protein [Lentisphaerota bacterium]